MTSDFPAERRFWFDPPFHPQSVGAAASAGRRRLARRLPAGLGCRSRDGEAAGAHRAAACARCSGDDARFEIEWASVYTFQCRRMQQFRHGRVLFAGDAAHLVVPFGARGANSGMQDADNLVVEARAGAARPGARVAARHLRRRARRGGRREHPQLDARDRLHHAEERDLAHVSRCGAGACAAAPVRAHARQQRPAVGAGGSCRFAAQHARRRCASPARWCPARRRRCAGRRRRAATGCSITWAAASRCLCSVRVDEATRRVARGRTRCLRVSCRWAARARRCRDRRHGPASPRAMTARAGHVLPVAPRPARLRALARVRSRRGVRAAIARATGKPMERAMDARSPTPNLAAPDDFYEELIDAAPRSRRRAERARQRQADPAACQPRRRPRRAARGDGGGARRTSSDDAARCRPRRRRTPQHSDAADR